MQLKERILTYIRHIPQIAGVEVSYTEKGLLMQLVLLKRKGNDVEVIKREGDIREAEKLLSHLPQDVPLVLTFNGKGIIHRMVKQADIKPDADLLRLVLPNAKRQDFYVQQVAQQNLPIISVIRKDRLQEMMKPFAVLENRVLAISLGPFSIAPFLSALRKENIEAVQLAYHQIQVEAEEIVAYNWLEQENTGRIIRIGNEEMNERFVVAFSLAFLTISEIPLAALDVEAYAGRMTEKRAQNQFKRFATALGLFVLLILLINTYFFLHYTEKVENTPVTDAGLLGKEISQLKEVLAGQEQLVEVISYVNRPDQEPLSYLADQIGQSVPKEILLDELTFFPQDEGETRKNRKPVYQAGLLTLKGSTANISALNHWVKAVSMMGFSGEVSLVTYSYDEKLERGVFTLKISLKE